jgi:hypothetical protein
MIYTYIIDLAINKWVHETHSPSNFAHNYKTCIYVFSIVITITYMI